MKFLFIIIVILLIVYLFKYNYSSLEGFHHNSARLRSNYRNKGGIVSEYTPITVAKNIRLNKFNQIDAITVKPPLPKDGELECHIVTCPSIIPSDVNCWRCS